MKKEIVAMRQFIGWTIVWKDKRRKKREHFLELVNQLFDSEVMECIEIRVKEHLGTRTEFEQINFG